MKLKYFLVVCAVSLSAGWFLSSTNVTCAALTCGNGASPREGGGVCDDLPGGCDHTPDPADSCPITVEYKPITRPISGSVSYKLYWDGVAWLKVTNPDGTIRIDDSRNSPERDSISSTDQLGTYTAQLVYGRDVLCTVKYNVVAPQCRDDRDNADSEDDLADKNDPGCHSDLNPGNPSSYTPDDDNETNAQSNLDASIGALGTVLTGASMDVPATIRNNAVPTFIPSNRSVTIQRYPLGSNPKRAFGTNYSGRYDANQVWSRTITDTAPLVAATYQVCVVADDTNAIDESNEGDNAACRDVVVNDPPQPNLVATIGTLPASIEPGKAFTIPASIKNASSVAVPPGSDRLLTIEKRPLGVNSPTNLWVGGTGAYAVGETWSNGAIAVTAPGTVGTYQICLRADTANVVNETIETDNKSCADLLVVTPPPALPLDLTLSIRKQDTIAWGSAVSIAPGEQVEIKSAPANAKTCSVVAGGFHLSPPAAETQIVSNVPEPTTGTQTYTVQCSDGTNTVTKSVSATIVIPPIDLTLSIRKQGTTAWGSAVTIGSGDQVEIRSAPTGAATCSVTDGGFSLTPPTGGTQVVTSVPEPTSGTKTYTVRCTNGTNTVSKSVTATFNTGTDDDDDDGGDDDGEVDLDLTIRKQGTSVWGSAVTIGAGDQVEIRSLPSPSASSCSVIAGGFTLTPPSDGMQVITNVTEPTSGTKTYTVRCTNGTSNISQSVTATFDSGIVITGDPKLTANPPTVRKNDKSTLLWETGGHPGCEITGTGISSTPLVGLTGSLQTNALVAESTFTLTCDDGATASATVGVLPSFIEI